MAFTRTTTNDSAAMAAFQAVSNDASRAVSAAPTGQCSKRLLAELLALNEEMILQLHVERVSDAGTAGFLTQMIAQHEKAAALLRSQLAGGVARAPVTRLGATATSPWSPSTKPERALGY